MPIAPNGAATMAENSSLPCCVVIATVYSSRAALTKLFRWGNCLSVAAG
jgi:hypothetical protein